MKTYFLAWEPYLILHRPYLVSFAFRMTGSLAEAEEIVQETFLECANIEPSQIKNHRAWLTKVCSNKSLDLLKSAYKKREAYIGTWLPDAVPDSFQFWGNLDSTIPPEKNLITNETLSTTFLLMAEKLNPEERVVYILSEVFDYSYKEISEFLNKSVETLRKVAQRARQAIASQKVKYTSTSIQTQKLIEDFFELVKNQDRSGLEAMLADDSEFWSDGGGKAQAVRVIMRERSQIIRFFASDVISSLYKDDQLKFEFTSINGQPGLAISKRDQKGLWTFDSLMNFEVNGQKIVRIFSQRNPDKLLYLHIKSRSTLF